MRTTSYILVMITVMMIVRNMNGLAKPFWVSLFTGYCLIFTGINLPGCSL